MLIDPSFAQVIFSMADEYVPEFVDKQALVNRFVIIYIFVDTWKSINEIDYSILGIHKYF